MKNKQIKWTKFRHRVIKVIIEILVGPVVSIKYHIKIDKFAEQGDRNWLILSNHQTKADQFFIGLAFKKPIYFLSLEDLFSKGIISKIISWFVAPIPILKGTSDTKAVKTCFKVAKEGGTIGVFPEGNRTYSGRTCYIKDSIASLAKKLGLPIAIFKIEGGYGVAPRWADGVRKGKMRAGVRRIIEPEEYASMSKEELYEIINRELWVDEAKDDGSYYGKELAKGLERVIYVCPQCGLSEFVTKGDLITCKHCGNIHRYLPNKQLESLTGESHFKYVAEWYDYQEAFARNLDLSSFIETPIYEEKADLYKEIIYKKKILQKKAADVRIFADRLEIDDKTVIYYDDVKAMACAMTHKLIIYHTDGIYQLVGDKSFNALKYCNIYYHTKYIKEEHHDGEFQFLGL